MNSCCLTRLDLAVKPSSKSSSSTNLTHFSSMADLSIIYNVAGNIIVKLGSSGLKNLGLLWGVDDELDKLECTLSAIKAVLLDVEERPFKSNTMKDWISKLKDVLYEIDDLIDEFSYETLRRQVMTRDGENANVKNEVCIFFSRSNRIGFRAEMSLKIREIRERLKAINDDKTQFSFSEHVIDATHDVLRERRETGSYIPEEEVIGRNDDKKKVIDLLLNSNTKQDIGIISIVGMGGLGKTALAQSIYNNNTMTTHFELKLWVCVSEEFDVKVIIQKIIESATRKKPESFLQIDSLQSELKRQIDGKKYLLIMDDVWNENDEKWVSLKRLLMGGAKGSRILITTRSEQVAKTFDTVSWYYLQTLDDYNSWLLFKKMTFLEGPEEELENLNLVKIGKEIVARLKGVPLAIRTIGRLLYYKKSQRFWLSFKDKELYQVMGQKDLEDMRSILELSYKHLPATLKQCFLYCALFPKDYEIQKDKLILQWRAQGFIQPKDQDKLVDIGEDYFMELLSRSFFQEVTKDRLGDIKACKMHDLMHDLACSITENECVHGLRNDIDKRTRHFSLGSMSLEESKELPETLYKARNLRTFFVLDYGHHYWEVDYEKNFHNHLQLRTLHLRLIGMDKFFETISVKFKHLRYLSISHLDFQDLPNSITELYNLETFILQYWTKLEKLPCDINNLINLKHLDLYGNNNLEFLPDSITQLNNLETLLLHGCFKLKELPRDTKKLINLEHLDTSSCWGLTHLPKGLGELTNLQTLNEFVLGKDNGAELSELNGLNKLRGDLYITNLQFCTGVNLQMNAKFLQLKSGLQELVLKWNNSCNEPTIDDLDDVYERVLDCLQPHSNLQEVSICGYKGVKLCNWVSSDSLGRLVTIRLDGCKRLQHLPQFDQFPYLKQLHLEDLPSIEYIGNNDSFSSSTLFFPSLEELRIVGTPKLKRWWKGTISTESTESTEASLPIIFPCLSELLISGCSLRILIPWRAPLKSLEIGDLEVGHSIEEDEFDIVPWIFFENLSALKLSCICKLEYLPKCLQHVTTLQLLTLWGCENLKSLPEWIGNLSSLTNLWIENCKNITLLPEGIQHIHGLQSLTIEGCPILEERCKKDTGEDWPKIAHIPSEESMNFNESIRPEGMLHCLDLKGCSSSAQELEAISPTFLDLWEKSPFDINSYINSPNGSD